MDGPEGLGEDRTGGEGQDEGADLAFGILVGDGGIAADEAGDAEGEQEGVFVEEIEGGKRVAEAQIKRAGSSKAQRSSRNGDGRRLGGGGSQVGLHALGVFGMGGFLRLHGGAELRLHARSGAERDGGKGNREPGAGASLMKPFEHPEVFSPIGAILVSDTRTAGRVRHLREAWTGNR